MQISPQGNKVFHLFSGTVSLLSPPASCFSITLSFSLSLLFSLCDSYCLALCPALPLKQSKWVVSWMNEGGAEWQRDNLEHLREGMNEQVGSYSTFHVFSLYWFFLLHLFLVSCLKISRFANKSITKASKVTTFEIHLSVRLLFYPSLVNLHLSRRQRTSFWVLENVLLCSGEAASSKADGKSCLTFSGPFTRHLIMILGIISIRV